VRYNDRILAAIPYVTQSLSDQNNRPFVQLDPSAADLAGALASRIFANYTAGAYNASNVVAIVSDNNLNAASQKIHGVDISAKYNFKIGSASKILLNADGSYLSSNQRLSADLPVTQLAGTIYNPPHFRGRAGVAWQTDNAGVNSYVNYSGPIQDTRLGYGGRSGGLTTIDLAAHYRFEVHSGSLKGVELSASAQNLFNASPRYLKPATYADPPYDPLNNSPVGRFLSLTVSKEW
jgi:hypothetical protein